MLVRTRSTARLGALLRAYPRWRPDGVWKAGTPDGRGRIRSDNGFNLFIAEGGEWKTVMTATRRRLRALTPMIEQGRKIGAEFQLDFGVMLGASEYWTRTALFAPKDLLVLADLGVELCVTAYPVSERSTPRRRRSRTAVA